MNDIWPVTYLDENNEPQLMVFDNPLVAEACYKHFYEKLSVRYMDAPWWDPKTDACDYCKECEYFLHEYWNCQGELEPCFEFSPKMSSKLKKVEIEIDNETNL